jgi:acetyl esterase/lipase
VKRFFLLLLVFSSFVACSPLTLINNRVSPRNFIGTRNVAYGSLERQKLDVYQPRKGTSLPVLIFVHGGSWRNGSKDIYPFLGERFALEGYVTVIINYRLAPANVFPSFVQDAALAVRWAKDNIQNFAGDPNQIYLAGHSAGAHIVAMLALDASFLKAVNLERSVLRGVVGMAGPYDIAGFFSQSESLRQVFGQDPKAWAATQPINFVDGTNPPMLLQHGVRDTTVNYNQSIELQQKILEKGGKVELKTYPKLEHEELIGAVSLAAEASLDPSVVPDIVNFLKRH